jgi:hypothetical protein
MYCFAATQKKQKKKEGKKEKKGRTCASIEHFEEVLHIRPEQLHYQNVARLALQAEV